MSSNSRELNSTKDGCAARRFVLFLCVVAIGAFLSPMVRAQSGSLTTTLTGTTTFASGCMFEVVATNQVTIDSFDVNFGWPAGVGPGGGLPNSGTFEVWSHNTPGSYVGSETIMTNWTLLATVPGLTSLGAGAATPLALSLGVTIPAGQSQSFYIVETTGAVPLNTLIGTAVGASFASDANIQINEGTSTNQVSFSNINAPEVFSGVVHYTLAPSLADDLSIELISPLNDSIGCNALSSFEQVMIEIRNRGMNPVTAGTILNVQLSVDGNPPITEFIPLSTSPLNTGGVIPYTFSAAANLAAIGAHTLAVSVSYAPDLDTSNNSEMININSGGQLRVSTFPYSENFAISPTSATDLPPGFINETTDATGAFSDWLILDAATPTPGTGPAAGNTTGTPGAGDGFLYVEDAGDFQTVNLRSPCFDFSGLLAPQARFVVYSDNTLSLDVISYPSGTVTADVLGPLSSSGSAWVIQNVNLTAFAGQVVQLVFRVNSMNSGATEPHDIAIDDLAVFEMAATPGQAPQSGLAVLDINNARNANAVPVGMAPGGPFFATVSVGQYLEFDLDGQSMQTIVLFSGALNPSAASFPGIGKMDVGGAVDPLTGLPMGLTLHGDGAAPGFFNSFLVTGAAGHANFRFLMPTVPAGILATFQTAFRTTATPSVALSNAVQVTVL